MLIPLLFCYVFFITITLGSNATSPDDHNLLAKEIPKPNIEADTVRTNLSIITEGGLVRSTPPMSLRKENDTILLNLVKELTKEKPVQSSDSKVKPRKGVVYVPDNSSVSESQNAPKHVNTSSIYEDYDVQVFKHTDQREGTTKPTVPLHEVKVNKTMPTVGHTAAIHVHKFNKTVPKKPLVLSNEALDRMEYHTNDLKIPAMQSSVKSATLDQIPSPAKEGIKRIQAATTSAHPGMLMPLVITILVVPMFAVLGYMALKRGQEAWKNRHYKRMDFLLDGMYNE